MIAVTKKRYHHNVTRRLELPGDQKVAHTSWVIGITRAGLMRPGFLRLPLQQLLLSCLLPWANDADQGYRVFCRWAAGLFCGLRSTTCSVTSL